LGNAKWMVENRKKANVHICRPDWGKDLHRRKKKREGEWGENASSNGKTSCQ